MNKNSITTRKLTVMALLTAISFVLAFLETSLPLIPSFLKIDISALPVLIGSFALGPWAGVIIALLKNLLHLPMSQTGGVGQLADFLVIGSMSLTAGYVYKLRHSRMGAFLGCSLGIAVMTVMGSLSNKYIMIPFYSKLMPIDKILEACASVNSLIVDVNTYILYAVVPFNIFKGLVISVVTLLIYKKLSPVIHGIRKIR
ncbi:MAG: ECF transporter S component [Bacillota bacterium]|nr:ECF transporter S component [Bacillota bacterium]